MSPGCARRDHGTGPAVLVRPDGHVAARGRPGSMDAVAGYLRALFGEPAASTPEDGAQHAVYSTVEGQR